MELGAGVVAAGAVSDEVFAGAGGQVAVELQVQGAHVSHQAHITCQGEVASRKWFTFSMAE